MHHPLFWKISKLLVPSTEMYPRNFWELVSDPLVCTELTLGTSCLGVWSMSEKKKKLFIPVRTIRFHSESVSISLFHTFDISSFRFSYFPFHIHLYCDIERGLFRLRIVPSKGCLFTNLFSPFLLASYHLFTTKDEPVTSTVQHAYILTSVTSTLKKESAFSFETLAIQPTSTCRRT